nr:MFS transporter [Candidatus Pantoea persica]
MSALLMKSEGIETTFFWYVSAMGALAFLVSLLLHKRGKGIRL